MWTSVLEASLHPSPAGTAPVRFPPLRAAAVSAVATALAWIGHHMTFGGTPSWQARFVAATVVFAAVLLWSVRHHTLRSHVAVMLGAQVVSGLVFEASASGLAVPGPDPVWAWGYLVAAVAAARMLHRAQVELEQLPVLAGKNLVQLVALLFARVLPVLRPRRPVPLRSNRYPGRHRQPLPLHGVLLADTVARRGPPAVQLPAA